MVGKPGIRRKSSRDGTKPKPLTITNNPKKVRHKSAAHRKKHANPRGGYGLTMKPVIPGVAPNSVGPKTGMRLPCFEGNGADFMEKILNLQNILKGWENVLFVGAGKSGEAWEDHCNKDTLVVAANSTIKHLADRANVFLCTEGNGYDLEWFHTETNAIRVVSYCNLKRPHLPNAARAMNIPDQIPIERGWHLAGFDPREYFNPVQLPDEIINDRLKNLYSKHRTYMGFDRHSKREWGLLKGPVCYPDNMSSGTVYVNGLHLLAFMGANKINSIGFEFCQKEEIDHWTEPTFKYRPSRWSPPECFMKINGHPTMWHFAMSASFAMRLMPKFEKAGVTIEDHSEGLMDLPGIENLLQHVHDKPRDFDLK